MSVTGMDCQMSVTGMDCQMSVTGMDCQMSVTGMDCQMSVTGMDDWYGLSDVYDWYGLSDICFWFGLRLYVPVNNFSVMSGQSHRFLGITGTFWEVNVSLLRIQHGDPSEDRTPDLSLRSPTLYTRPPRLPQISVANVFGGYMLAEVVGWKVLLTHVCGGNALSDV